MTVLINHPRISALFCSIAVLAACASQPVGRELDLAASPTLNVMTQADIANSHATTAYQAVQLLRPMYLLSGVDLAPTEQREVYLNGVPLGGVDELRLIPASEVQEIRFVRAIDGGTYGLTGTSGGILVISRVGH